MKRVFSIIASTAGAFFFAAMAAAFGSGVLTYLRFCVSGSGST